MSRYQLYYDEVQILPAPQINISREPVYVGDNQIGNNYTIDINGFAISTTVGQSDTPKSLFDVSAIKYALHKNGKTLRLYDSCSGSNAIIAKGGKIMSFNVEEGNWYNYIKYNATFEFSDVTIYDYAYGLNNDTIPVADDFLMYWMYRLKNYNDNWNFSISDQDAFKYYTRLSYANSGAEIALSMEDHSQMQVSYTINATGKNYYQENGTSTAAWEAAKNFVQYKMYHQIYMFRNGGILTETPFLNTSYNSNEFGNPVNRALTSNVNFQAIPAFPPILDLNIVAHYGIYNETIDCSASELEGTFNATYNCTLKGMNTGLPVPQNSEHSYSATYEQTRDFRSQNRTITVNGQLKGMLRTNILENINDGQNFILPFKGVFFGIGNDTVSKFGNAYQDFVDYVVNPQIDDLKDNFKYVLGINYESLFPVDAQQQMPCIQERGFNFLYQVLAEPKSFNASYNYRAGTVDYTATYDTERACAAERGFQSMTVTEDDALPVYAEHTVVGRTRGVLIQDLNTNKSKTITITFQGVTKKTCGKRNPFSIRPDDLADPSFEGLAVEPCDTEQYTELPETIQKIFFFTELAAKTAGTPLIIRSFNRTYNPVDGSYDVSITYLVAQTKGPDDTLCPEIEAGE